MKGEGVTSDYKDRASAFGDILWHVKIKGRRELSKGIPLHMSLKVFEDRKEMDLKEIREKIEKFKVRTPDPNRLDFKTTIFPSERDGTKYYMLIVKGTDKAYEDFYNSMKHCGTVYKNFMMHITLDKDLYDKINKEGLRPDEIEFDTLTVEHGAGNTIYRFEEMEKTESMFSIARETITLNPDLHHHLMATVLDDETLGNYIDDNPGLMEEVFKKHEKRIIHHFGNDMEAIEFAKSNGIDATYDFLRKRK